MVDSGKLPIHFLEKGSFPVCVEDITYDNPYDSTSEHRHNYFEILFFEEGGGSQLIDFTELPVIENSCYIVFPQQIHLLKRGADASGRLIQFREEVIISSQIKILLHKLFFGKNPAVIFENNVEKLQAIKTTLDLIQETAEKQQNNAQEITLHLLQALLLQLLDNRCDSDDNAIDDDRKLLFEFQQLLEEQYLKNHKVQEFVSLLNTTEKKLSVITKKHLGLSPLQVIHKRLVLEAKRILIFENTSHKEIAYHLGFDSPASFSNFIKNKTGFTPSDLSVHLANIHK